MDMTALLLLVAFRHRIKAADIGAGIATFETIIGRKVDEGEFRDGLTCAVARGDLRDPVRLLPRSLQCHWHVELTPEGVNTVRALLRDLHLPAASSVENRESYSTLAQQVCREQEG